MRNVLTTALLFVGLAMAAVLASTQIEANRSGPVNQAFWHGKLQIELQYADAPAASVDAELRKLVTQALDTYSALFGGLPRDTGGEPYQRLRFEIKRGAASYGETDPGLVQLTLSDQKVFGQATWPLIVLHEVFHLWSAETFRYRTGEEQWFNEGVTELYALRTAAELGIIGHDEMPVWFAVPLATYVTAKGLGSLSMREAGSTEEKKRAHYFLVYHGGLMAGLVLDREIRRQSGGTRSLDDLMRWLYNGFDARERRYTLEDLARGLDEIGSGHYRPFLEQYVSGRLVIPVANYLDLGTLAMEAMGSALLPEKPATFSDPHLAAAVGLRRERR